MVEPLRTTTFTLTQADALAYEQASWRMSPMGVLALVLWLGFCGAVAWFIPRDFAGPLLSWSFSILVSLLIAIGSVLALLVIAVRQYWRARRRLSRPEELTLTEWPDRLEIVGNGLPRELPFLDIRESILGRTHLFLVSDHGMLILPSRVFPEAGVIEQLAARIAGRPALAPVDAGAGEA